MIECFGENVPGIPGACTTRNFYVSDWSDPYVDDGKKVS